MVRNRKETERPTLSCSSSCEEELKHHRLGRVVQDDEATMMTTIPRREEDVLASSTPQELLQAIDTLHRLASLDSSDYQARLRENSLPIIRIEQPHLSKLTQSIHRFHSMVTNLTRENDQQTTELIDMQNEVDASKQRIAKLEKAVSKLHGRNLKLKKQSKSDKSMARKLMDQVKSFTANAARRKEEEEFFQLASKVQQHEQVMMRERSDSNFSDVDGLQDFDNGSVDSYVSTQSLVTDDGVATLRIQRERTFTWPNINTSNEEPMGSNESPARINDVAPGMDTTTAPSKRTKALDSSNPFAMFLARKPVQPYTLSLVAPFSLQFVSLQQATAVTPPAITVDAAGTEPPSVTETVFAVCGYQGFDSNANVKPTLGARLLAINKEPVNRSWSMEELEQAIVAEGTSTTMTFRNDLWDRKQKEALHLAHERLHPQQRMEVSSSPFLRKRTQSGDSVKQPNQLLGFWNFHHHSPKGQSSEESSKEEQPKTPEVSSSNTNNEEPATQTQTTKDSPLNNVISSFFKMNQGPPSREVVSFEEDDSGDLSFPLPTEEPTTSDDAVVSIDDEEDDEVVEISESDNDGTVEHSSTTPGTSSKASSSSPNKQAADKFKSSMKNMGKLFAFR